MLDTWYNAVKFRNNQFDPFKDNSGYCDIIARCYLTFHNNLHRDIPKYLSQARGFFEIVGKKWINPRFMVDFGF